MFKVLIMHYFRAHHQSNYSMKNICSLAILFLLPAMLPDAYAQTDFIPLGSKQYQLLDRLDIKLRSDTTLGFTTMKPYGRKDVTERVEYIDSLDRANALPFHLSRIDRYNIRRLLMDNAEWTRNYTDSFRLRKPLFHTFYKTPSNLFAVNERDFKLIVNPVLDLQLGHANDGTGSLYVNTRGVVMRGNIGNKLGFYSYLTDTQERDPVFVRNFVDQHYAVPGAGFFKDYKRNGYDYFDARGGITFNITRFFNFQFAYDKLFVGNGFRSLLLSDFSSNYLFLRMRTRIWKLDYETVIAQTIAPFYADPDRKMRPQNYMSLHHLSLQATKWLNLGLYENIMEEGKNGLQLSYLNPVIFYRSIEQQLGAAGKANIGLDFKANFAKDMQLYGTILINEFVTDEVLHYRRGDWRNKHGAQIGLKYNDVLHVKNLDLQLEMNAVRPYTYTNFDSTTNLTHYNQPLAHPLGANFREMIAIVRYQPLPRLYLTGRLIHYKQGLDSAGINYGGDIFRSYAIRPYDKGVSIGNGVPVHSTTASLRVSYEIFENAFIDLNGTYRNYNVLNKPASSTFFYTIGFRMNIQPREFIF